VRLGGKLVVFTGALRPMRLARGDVQH